VAGEAQLAPASPSVVAPPAAEVATPSGIAEAEAKGQAASLPVTAQPWFWTAAAGAAVVLLLLLVGGAFLLLFSSGNDGVTVDGGVAVADAGGSSVEPGDNADAAIQADATQADATATDANVLPVDGSGGQPVVPPTPPTFPPAPAAGTDGHTPADIDVGTGADTLPGGVALQIPGDAAPRETVALSGQSRRFDDRECVALQNAHGVLIPPTADIIEVSGQRLPLRDIAQLQQSVAPVLILPKGIHTVRFRRNENPFQVKIETHFLATYNTARAYFGLGGNVRTAELLMRGAWAYDSHGAPFLLNFYGASYAGQQQWEAAQRKFRRALRVNPTFAPAHLNLAHVLLAAGDAAGAREELALAAAFNIGNVYGLAHAISAMQETTAAPQPAGPAKFSAAEFTPVVAARYFSQQQLSAEDQRIEALLLSLSKYAVRHSERGKIINNLAAHLADAGNTDAALEYYRAALEALKLAAGERLEIARKVLQNMAAACKQAGYEEAAEYQQMRNMVTQ